MAMAWRSKTPIDCASGGIDARDFEKRATSDIAIFGDGIARSIT